MNRRDFLVGSTVFTSIGLLGRLGAQPASATPVAAPKAVVPATEFKALRRDVGIFTGQGGTIGWLANRHALLAVDTQFPATASLFLAGLPGRNGRTLDAVLNTHHHPDHTSGNKVFRSAAKTIVAHTNVPRLQAARAEKDGKGGDQVFADSLFPDVWRRDLGGEIVTAQYHGAAHTSGDVIVTFEKANVVHMGDLVFNRLYPVIDRGSGGTIRGWIRLLEDAARTYPADAVYIFGHGKAKFGVTGERKELLMFRDYLSGLLEYVQKRISGGESKDSIVRLENLPGFDDFHVAAGEPNRLPANLGAAYDELTEKAG